MGSYTKAFVWGFGIVGGAYALMLTTKLSPELKRQYEQVKSDQARRQAMADVIRRAAEDPEPMWIKKKTPPTSEQPKA
ncbi:hypothetical protein BGW38_008436 [Lunasporangiospora selenospora]|uniref:Assembly factor cbp4 n=1 Tax=Lunasporangiospora selenospora TaxID=979761 RepID=A0A9P6FYL4_9FUNG|nr:hypothetical protein BGW38_008436 [Lunasporangiospora selenospora]